MATMSLRDRLDREMRVPVSAATVAAVDRPADVVPHVGRIALTPPTPSPMKHDPVRVLAISGSLRARSANTAVLEAARQLAPPGMEVELYRGIADLPAFNPDHEHPTLALPRAAAELRGRVAGAAALLISSPEYAHGIPGALKNLLDWLVGSVVISGKPVALISVFERSLFVQPQLAEVLRTMSARLVPAEAVMVPIARRDMNAAAIAAQPGNAAQLRRALTGLLRSLASV